MLQSPRRALLVIDVQEEYVSGGLRVEFPEVHESLRHIGEAMDAARAAMIPVVVVQNTAAVVGAPLFDKGSPGWQFHAVVATRSCDHALEKTLPSAFAGTDLGVWLENRQINTLTVVGYMTQNCCDATIRQALHAGFAVEFLSDASGSVSYKNRAGTVSAEDIHRAFSVVLQARFAAVLTTAEWIDVIRTNSVPERDTILSSRNRFYAPKV
ncbi:MAG: cysteine hydrolase family protein [Acidiferrobacter sp.]